MGSPTDTLQDIHREEVRAFLSQASRRRIYSTLALAVVLVLSLGQPHLAFLLLVFAVPFLAWLTWSAWVLVRHPYLRVAQAICILVWFLAIALVLAVHAIGHRSARRDANEIAKTIITYQLLNRRCPDNLEGLLKPRPHLVKRFRAEFDYECAYNRPYLSYAVTFTLLDRYEYDFERHAWRYRSWAAKRYFMDIEAAEKGMPEGASAPAVDEPAGLHGQGQPHRR